MVVIALPRGGVPVAYEVAQALEAPLDVCIVRKLGVPGHEELAMGAIATGAVRVINEDVIRHVRITDRDIERVAAREAVELAHRERAYRAGQEAIDVRERMAVLIDDGIATGATAQAAAQALHARGAQVVIGIPVAPPESGPALQQSPDRVILLATPSPFISVGAYYRNFVAISDREVQSLLQRRAASRASDEGRDQPRG